MRMATSTVLDSFNGSYQQKFSAAIMSLVPAGMTTSVHYIGKPILLDPTLDGTFRFARGVGNSVGVIISDVTARLTSDVSASSTTLNLVHVPKWITSGCWVTVNRGDLLRVASVDPYAKTVTFEFPQKPVPYSSNSLMRLHSVPCSQVGDKVASRVYVRPSDSRVMLLQGDYIEQQTDLNQHLARRRFRVLGASVTLDGAYSVDLDSEPDYDFGDGGAWYLVARPAYVSSAIVIPSAAKRFSPLVFDAPTSPLNVGDFSDPSISTYCKVTVYSLDGTGSSVSTGQATNSIVETAFWPSTFLLFGQASSGSLDFDKTTQRVLLQPADDWMMVSLPVLSIIRRAEGFKCSVSAESSGVLQVIVDDQAETFDIPAGESTFSVTFGFYPGGFGYSIEEDQREEVLPTSNLKLIWTPSVAESTLGVGQFEALGARAVEMLSYVVLMPDYQPESLAVGPASVKPLMTNLEVLTASEGDSTDSGFIAL